MNIDLLTKLCGIHGVSGHEGRVADFIAAEIKDYVDECAVDAMGNLIAHKKGPGKKMMLAGHMDQIGLIVTYISDEGFLHFSNIGGMRHGYCLGNRFVFENGTIATCAAIRLKDPKDLAFDKMYLDIGARDAEDAAKYVKIGDVCTFADVPKASGGIVLTPALDDRVGCFIMIEALKKLTKPAFDLYFVFTSQEEMGLRGARTSAFSIDPDYGLAFDVTGSFDTPKTRKFPSKMYGGACIKLKDASLLCHPAMIAHLERCAKEAGVKYQFEILEAGGTDSGAIHTTKSGVPSGVISVASRYIHSANEMCAISDIEDCVNLTVAALEVEVRG